MNYAVRAKRIEDYNKCLGLSLKLVRIGLGFKLKHLDDFEIGHISQIENGHPMSVCTFLRLCDFYGVEPSTVLQSAEKHLSML